MAERFWPGENPLGQRVFMEAHKASFEIVGVVADVRPFRPDRSAQPQIYWPFAQMPRWAVYFIVRSAGSAAQQIPAIRARLEALDPEMDFLQVTTMDERVAAQLINPRFNLSLGGLFAGLALLIAALGIYGVMAFYVSQRTREFGVRMALGAHRGDILRLVLGRGVRLAAAGLALGLAGALGVTRVLQNLLIGVAPTDTLTFAATGLLLLGVALVACWLPARRATRVDPMTALRYE